MPRLFVAIDLPDDIKDRLIEVSKGVAGAKWLSRDQLHLTLRFIGETDEKQFQAIRSLLNSIRGEPFEIALKGVGQFPPKGAARVLWAGLDVPPALVALQRRIELALTGLGLPPEDKPFSAHVTLSRLKTPPNPETIRQFLLKNAALQSPPFVVREFVLYSSFLRPEGPFYRHEGVYPLTPEVS
ncbi:MAG: RNA 2',3'-cyclic phosphodiesterase [Chloroflexi bacterium]|nr:RNA 2',3'-cyclic phosphodiesterase [Chloroflexota bacterium]